MTAQQAQEALDAGCDFVMLWKAAVLQSDLPRRIEKDPNHQPPPQPVTEEYLKTQGLSGRFIDYMRTWDGFVAD